ncbi:MAG TPA: hypothetical protein VOA80_03765 [Thermoanaerobaculia bacterium]|nr:hypothetical protein [Thermoanaerobaculia bacterium]
MTSPETGAAPRRLEWAAAALLSLFTVWAHGERLVHGGGLWRDEAAAVRMATLPSLRAIWRLFPHEAFPLAVPLAIRSFIGVAGSGDGALRVFGMLVGLAVAAALWVSARAAGRTLPLLSLALLAGNAPFLVFGDSLRGYGLGSLCIVLGFAALAGLLRRPGPWPATAALLAMVGAVQCLLGNAALVAALCTAAALAAVVAVAAVAAVAAPPAPATAKRPRTGRRVAFVAINIGLAAAVSLLPYAAPLMAARAWSVVVVYHPGLRQIVRMVGATLGPALAAWAVLAVLAVAGTAWTLAVRRRPSGNRQGDTPGQDASVPVSGATASGSTGARATESLLPSRSSHSSPRPSEDRPGADALRLFAVLALVLGIAAQLLFQEFLAYTPRAWYDLPLLALVACALEPLVAALCRTPLARLARVALAVALAAAMLPYELPRLRLRMTNADLVARRLASMAAPDDLVVVSPWYYGVSFDRYYRGPASWTTLPDLAEHDVHRYDLVKAKLAAPHPIDDVLAAAQRTLSGGHRVWLVGQLRLPPPGQVPAVLPPAPASPAGWHDFPYVESWALQLGAMLRAHAGALARVPVPSPDPVSPLENMTLAVATGWRP